MCFRNVFVSETYWLLLDTTFPLFFSFHPVFIELTLFSLHSWLLPHFFLKCSFYGIINNTNYACFLDLCSMFEKNCCLYLNVDSTFTY